MIAVSGGGIRAAVWTFVVLSELEAAFAERHRDFPAHVRLITGASGGDAGAGYDVATLPPPAERLPQPAVFDARNGAETEEQWLAEDTLTPLVRRSAFNDMPSWLSPWPLRHDRGQALTRGPPS